MGVRSRPGAARTILLSHIISARPSKQPLTVRTFLKVYMELVFYFLFLQEQIKDIITRFASRVRLCCQHTCGFHCPRAHEFVTLFLTQAPPPCKTCGSSA